MKKNLNVILFLSIILFIGINKVNAEEMCAVCGSEKILIPMSFPKLVSSFISIIQIALPIVLIVTGMIKFSKVVISGEEKVAKEKTSLFIKSIIYAVVAFLVVAIVKFILSSLGNEASEPLSCMSCFVSGECMEVVCQQNTNDSNQNNNFEENLDKEDNTINNNEIENDNSNEEEIDNQKKEDDNKEISNDTNNNIIDENLNEISEELKEDNIADNLTEN